MPTDSPVDLILDMETQDPDDALTLCLVAGHPGAALRAVTVTPGSRQQVGLVRKILRRLGRDEVPVGARLPETDKRHVSAFHDRWLGDLPAEDPDGLGHEVLARALTDFPAATLLTGAALQNPRLLLENHPEVSVARWVGQGGFAGDSVVPPEHRLEKFEGRETCPTYNFNGDPEGARRMLEDPRVEARQLVSKNVCHGVVYDADLHARLAPERHRHPGLDLLVEGMETYLERGGGKKFHDPLAACVALRPEVVESREVHLYRVKGEWGSVLQPGSGTWISVAVDHDAFVEVLLGG